MGAVPPTVSQTPSADCSVAPAQQATVGSTCNPVSFVVDSPLGNPAAPNCGGFVSTGEDGWCWFTATSTSTTISYNNTNQDAMIFVYSGTCGALTQIACADAWIGASTETVTLATVIGQTYYVRICRYSGTAGQMNGNLCIFSALPNDLCGNALPVNCGSTIAATTVGGGTDLIPAGCGFSVAGGVWYSIAGNGNVITASLCTGTTFDTQLSVFAGTCASLTCVDTNDDFCGLQSEVSWLSATGVTYYILVHGYYATGPFNLAVSCAPYVPSPQDCAGSISICSDTQFGGNSSGSGIINDLNPTNQGCLLSGENQSSWYVFSPTTTGTISFAINPTPLVDYDFAIWGPLPSPTCPMVGPPLRCSFSALVAPTGLGNGATDTSEGASGNGWVQPITVTSAQVGQYYFMCLDNFSGSTTPFVFDWTLSGVVLNCAIMLPVQWLTFTGQSQGMQNVLEWTTASEMNNSHFEVMRSTDAIHFEKIGEVNGSGFSFTEKQYSFIDRAPQSLTQYYQLRQIDFNGESENSSIIAVQRHVAFSATPNPVKDELMLNIEIASDQIITIELTDLAGRVILQQQVDSSANHSVMLWKTDQLPTGLYSIQAITPEGAMLMQHKVLKY